MESFKFVRLLARGKGKTALAGILVTCLLCLSAGTARAQDWWNSDWQYQRQIDLVTTPQGADIQEALSDIPVLVRLHAGNFKFANAKPDGSDIRFVAGEDATPLKHQIDSYDATDEVALIWVKVPKILANSAQNHIFMYYGNEKAAQAQDGPGTFAGSHVLVFHLGEAEGVPKDATGYKNHASAFSGGQALPSVIGNGMALYGGGEKIVVPHSPSLKLADGFTVSTWLRIGGPAADGYLFTWGDSSGTITIGINNTAPYASITRSGQTTRTGGTALLIPGAWHYLTVTAQPGKKLTLYLDGQEATAVDLPGLLPNPGADILVGASPAGDHRLAVELDEIVFSSDVRSSAWIKAMFASQGMDAKLVSYGAEVAKGGGGGAIAEQMKYMRTIGENITFDGWLVLGFLVILGLMSAMVLVMKSYYIYLYEKGNKAFHAAFVKHGGLFCLDGEYEEFDNSPLHRVYRSGCETLAKIFGNNKDENVHPRLTNKELNIFKTALEKGYIQETKVFNDWLLVMTMAISGGPFLGLLGTVWGVMNTFAAMAHAGEANLMAIAPGVASALACTVIGLLVAIPSLFGYNYVSGKIKVLTADIGIFIDEFILLVDDQHGEE